MALTNLVEVGEHVFAMPRPLRFTEEELRFAIAASRSWAETLRRLRYRSAGGNWRTIKKYAALWSISTELRPKEPTPSTHL